MSSTVFIAVECYQCSTMQVKQQKKSSNKWTCVVCNEKQSVRKVLFQSFMAKDVRQLVQSRNMARKVADEQASSRELQPITMLPAPSSFCFGSESKRRSDWSEYLDPAEDDSEQQESVEEGEVEVVTEMRPKTKRAKYRRDGDGRLKQTANKEQVKECEGRSLKYEASKLGDANTRSDSTMGRERATTKASKWDDYITKDEDEW